MHTTTVRFGEETWAELKAVCERDGIATAQYIREATIARLAAGPRLDVRPEVAELRSRVERVERIVARLARGATRPEDETAETVD